MVGRTCIRRLFVVRKNYGSINVKRSRMQLGKRNWNEVVEKANADFEGSRKEFGLLLLGKQNIRKEHCLNTCSSTSEMCEDNRLDKQIDKEEIAQCFR